MECLSCFLPLYPYLVMFLFLFCHPLHLCIISFLPYLNSLLCASRCPVLLLDCCVSTLRLNELSSFSMLLNELLDLSSSSCAFLDANVTDMGVYRHDCDSAIGTRPQVITACRYTAISHVYKCDIVFIQQLYNRTFHHRFKSQLDS